MRALDLGYPDRIVVNMQDGKQVSDKAAVEFHFPAATLVLEWDHSLQALTCKIKQSDKRITMVLVVGMGLGVCVKTQREEKALVNNIALRQLAKTFNCELSITSMTE